MPPKTPKESAERLRKTSSSFESERAMKVCRTENNKTANFRRVKAKNSSNKAPAVLDEARRHMQQGMTSQKNPYRQTCAGHFDDGSPCICRRSQEKLDEAKIKRVTNDWTHLTPKTSIAGSCTRTPRSTIGSAARATAVISSTFMQVRPPFSSRKT